ncbi:hypothetical protein OE88DRAFT_956492 [Heliocybe sulcata]|uniref:Uncharacterized protein n=1 Tax=Heliocybe sulcata TaxID=5364 RepID=A0A5C3NBV9_9AGAM|nr:hypothetical protein OE88DRAFT_956492 [Heliocybe sulcata]
MASRIIRTSHAVHKSAASTIMLHSFVAAKLLPRLPVWASYGQRVATSLVTTPFLALHLYETASDPLAAQAFPNLFIISREKPDLPGNQYFALNQSKAEAQAEILTVVPPLPFRHPLYLSVTPRIRGDFSYSETYELLGKMGTYQLEQSSLDRLMAAIAEAGPSIPGIRETGGDDEPAPDWDTLSGESPREAPGVLEMRRYVPLSFDLVSFSELSDNFDMSVLKETALYRQ